jgi:hypothetical protein
MRNQSKPAAQMSHAGEMAKSSPPAQVAVVNQLVEALDQLVEHHTQAAVRDRPELMRDADIRREYFGDCCRTHYWQIAKMPGFPKVIEVSPRIRLRRRSEIERWLAEREQAA